MPTYEPTTHHQNGHIDILNLLIRHKGDINQKDSSGASPLNATVYQRQRACAQPRAGCSHAGLATATGLGPREWIQCSTSTGECSAARGLKATRRRLCQPTLAAVAAIDVVCYAQLTVT